MRTPPGARWRLPVHFPKILIPAATLAAALLVATPSAAARTQSSGTVTKVVDGDTVWVDITGDGTSAPVKIRNAGIQAVERGQCHYTGARQAMNAVADHKVVTLTAKSAASVGQQNRPIRFADVVGGPAVVDTQLRMLQGGWVVPLITHGEDWRARSYQVAAQVAAASGQHLWNPTACGPGPAQGTPLKMWINYDGDGYDTPNSEWVKVENMGTAPIELGQWWIRTAARDSVRFPAGTVVAPGRVLTLSVGQGTNRGNHFYWGSHKLKFRNVRSSQIGGGAYLFDPDGDLRAHSMYPCLVHCTDAALGRVRMAVHYDAAGVDNANVNDEYVTVRSTDGRALDLGHYVFSLGGRIRELGGNTVLRGRQSLVIHMGRGTASARVKYLGQDHAVLANSGGTVSLRDTVSIVIRCQGWRGRHC